jgi:DNA-binding NarL/FixJ family response regulator
MLFLACCNDNLLIKLSRKSGRFVDKQNAKDYIKNVPEHTFAVILRSLMPGYSALEIKKQLKFYLAFFYQRAVLLTSDRQPFWLYQATKIGATEFAPPTGNRDRCKDWCPIVRFMPLRRNNAPIAMLSTAYS